MLAVVGPPSTVPHVPVLLSEVCAALCPIGGRTIIDGTFGAGGYSRAFLEKNAKRVLAIDRDRAALSEATWAADEPRLTLVEGVFGDLADLAEAQDLAGIGAVVLDIGVSSMQLDQSLRGFSFMRDGPLDMRMSASDGGPSAADLVNGLGEAALADIIHYLGEDRAARRIARAIVRARADGRIETTLALADVVARALPRPRPGQSHPATRTFQALRIAVNDELGELVRGLAAAERILMPGGRLVVVTFHSLEDRIVKRFLQQASATSAGASRHGPARNLPAPRFERPPKAVEPGDVEVEANPRARSARLRTAVRTSAASVALDPRMLGLPSLPATADALGWRS
ncbi:MAG: 16S rRNA (cytosine(1402)-N(4))-methyltransferase RsmH [Pseudomonadota bacterium]